MAKAVPPPGFLVRKGGFLWVYLCFGLPKPPLCRSVPAARRTAALPAPAIPKAPARPAFLTSRPTARGGRELGKSLRRWTASRPHFLSRPAPEGEFARDRRHVGK